MRTFPSLIIATIQVVLSRVSASTLSVALCCFAVRLPHGWAVHDLSVICACTLCFCDAESMSWLTGAPAKTIFRIGHPVRSRFLHLSKLPSLELRQTDCLKHIHFVSCYCSKTQNESKSYRYMIAPTKTKLQSPKYQTSSFIEARPIPTGRTGPMSL